MHHPPAVDLQEHIQVDHNPRPNEIALRDYLSRYAKLPRALCRSAGHIHNYERNLYEGVMYLVSGGEAQASTVNARPKIFTRALSSELPIRVSSP
jgi:hypothetical protein